MLLGQISISIILLQWYGGKSPSWIELKWDLHRGDILKGTESTGQGWTEKRAQSSQARLYSRRACHLPSPQIIHFRGIYFLKNDFLGSWEKKSPVARFTRSMSVYTSIYRVCTSSLLMGLFLLAPQWYLLAREGQWYIHTWLKTYFWPFLYVYWLVAAPPSPEASENPSSASKVSLFALSPLLMNPVKYITDKCRFGWQ